MSRIRFLLIFIFFCNCLSGQSDYLVIDSIFITGNKKTKQRVIEREIPILKGDTILLSDLPEKMEEIEKRLKSIGLFNQVTASTQKLNDDKANLSIELAENWYIYIVPIFDLADRNFNVWWQEQGRSLDRVNYGVRIRHYNFTGQKDPLKITLQAGYTRKLQLEYTFPYLSDNNNLGLAGSFFYSDNNEIPYITQGNKSLFYQHPDERILLKRLRSSFILRSRPNFFTHHSLSLEFHRNWVDRLVVDELNPNYFLDDRQSIKFFMLNYDIQYDKRPSVFYPYKGYRLFLNAKKEGLWIFEDQNRMLLDGGIEYYIPIMDNFSFGSKIVGKTNLIRDPQSFANNTGLGWSNDIVTGYDLYVQDGIDHILILTQLKRKMFETNLNMKWFKFFPDQLRRINVQFHLRLNFDTAYVNDPVYFVSNTQNNRWIYGFGPALDIIIYNSYLFSFEYSFNDLGERGLFINTSNSF